uniref:CTCK domain-containing protein n=1 Tax=Callorhinchus milii TaxID=7868 RepID=A0A4W3GGE8_CALMI
YNKTVKVENCEETIQVQRCEGHCRSATDKMSITCECCRELKTEEKSVELKCENGTSMNYKYINIESCSYVPKRFTEYTAK